MKKTIILLSLLLPGTSLAYCYSSVNNNVILQTISFGTITVLPGTANGTVLKTISLPG